MSASGKRNRIAPLPMQVKRRSFAFNDEMENEEGCWRSIDNLKQTPGRACVREWNGKACRRCRCIIYWPTLTFSLFFPRTRKVFISNRKFSRKPKRLKYSQHKRRGRLYVYFMMIVRSTSAFQAHLGKHRFRAKRRKVKNCFCFLLFPQRRGKKTFRHLIFSFILWEKLNEIEIALCGD